MSKSGQGEFKFFLYDKVSKKRCSLESIEYKITAKNYSLSTLNILHYKNKNVKPTEIVFKFSVTDKTIIHNIEVEIMDPKTKKKQKYSAKIKTKEKAKEQYEDSISEGKSAMLVEEDDDDKDIIALNLGNIKSQFEVTVFMSTISEAILERGASNNIDVMKLIIPSMNYSGKNLSIEKFEKNMNVTCDIECSGEILKIESPSHEKFVESSIGNGSKLEPSNVKCIEKISPINDFILNVHIKRSEMGLCMIEKNVCNKNEMKWKYSSMISIVPKVEETSNINSEIIIIIDCSGSMSGGRMRCAKEAVIDCITKMREKKNIKINIVKFGTKFESLFTTPQEMTKNVNEKVDNFIKEVDSNMCSTDILSPIKFVLEQNVSANFSRQVLLLTDGEDSNTKEIIQYVKKYAHSTRFFTFGIGRGINPILLNQIAFNSNGRVLYIQENKNINKVIIRQMEFVLQQSLLNGKVMFYNNENEVLKKESVIMKVPPCFNYQIHNEYFFVNEIPKKVSFEFILNEKKKNINLNVQKVNNFIQILSAKRKVLELENKLLHCVIQKEKNEIKNEIITLGFRNNFITSQTSFILTMDSNETITDEVDIEEINPIIEKQVKVKKQKKVINVNKYTYKPPKTSYYSGGGYGGGYGGGGGCYSIDSNVLVKINGLIETKMICHLQIGDLVESVNEKGIIVYSKVYELLSHGPFELHLLKITNELGNVLKLSSHHLIYTSKNIFTLSFQNFKAICASQLEEGDYILTKDKMGKIVSTRIAKINRCKEKVANPYTENGNIIVNGIVTSCYTSNSNSFLFLYLPERARFGSTVENFLLTI